MKIQETLEQFPSKAEFENFHFVKKENGVKVIFMKYFYFDLSDEELNSIGKYSVEKNTIYFDAKQGIVDRKLIHLLLNNLHRNLKFRNGTRTVFIDNSPLIGARRFGIIDSDTNCIEVRPVTGCNLNCNYCSVDEGIKVKKTNYLIDRALIVNELRKLAEKKKSKELYIHISAQGEPLLYGDLIGLVNDISKISKVKEITIGSNGTFLTEELIDQLVEAGLSKYNLSINAIDPEIAKKIAGCDYNIEKIKDIARYLAQKLNLIIAPTLIRGFNESEMPKIIEFCKEIGAKIGIQNFLEYNGGRNPADQLSWESFREKMKKWEEETGVKLINPDYGFEIKEDKVLDKPFKKGDLIVGEYAFEGYIVSGDRLINVLNMGDRKGRMKVKILSDKYNTFTAKIS